MKFLYIAAEHVSGTLSLFQAEHRRRGHDCRFVTFWHSRWNFPDDICLNLPFMPDRGWVRQLRGAVSTPHDVATVYTLDHLPYWDPNVLGRTLFSLRDALNWPRIRRAIGEHALDSFDVITLDGGLDFTRDARFVRDCRSRGAHIAAFYHGTDLRNRGIIRSADECIELRLTSEWDLLEIDQRLQYLYLPFETSRFAPRDYRFHRPLRIGHAARNPYKGTARLRTALDSLSKRHPLEPRWFTDLTHEQVLAQLTEIDIFVDQLTNAGGWGYGMSSVEALAAGVPVITNIPAAMQNRLDDHPFVQADELTVETVLEQLILDEQRCRELSTRGRAWVVGRHDLHSVTDNLYSYYERLGWLRNASR
ncbi:hypothetical protein HZB60_05490 [candidate division KSB1 bacterium]|nr:hypothetical protein [candidate division KSB1 bacterium]